MRRPHISISRALTTGALSAAIMVTLIVVTSQSALAQATTGTIRGVVTDQTGAIVGSAKVAAKNQATGVESPSFETTGSGVFAIPNLVPGKYTLVVKCSAFKQNDLTDIDVRLGQDSLVPVTLQPGAVDEIVTITASAETALQRSTSQIATSIDARRVTDLPITIAGGGLDVLALLAPGVTPTSVANVSSSGTALSVNGSRSRAVSFNIDGQDNNDQEVAGLLYAIDNPDIIADYQVITGGLPARYGRNSAGIINVVTKTGTNTLHGSAYWFYRDKSLFDSRVNPDPLAFAREGTGIIDLSSPGLDNIYGVTIGGPIVKDKLFFFASYQGHNSRTGNITAENLAKPALLPAGLQALKADFPNSPAVSAFANFSPFAITDFGTVQPAPGEFFTANIAGKQYPAAIPERVFRQPFDENEFTGRIDLKLSEKDMLWGRYLFQNPVFRNLMATLGQDDPASGFTGDGRTRTQTIGGGWDHQLSSRALNSLTFAYSRFRLALGGGCDGLVGCIVDPLDKPGSTITDILAFRSPFESTVGSGNFTPEARLAEVFQIGDNLTLLRGKHQLVAGADIRRLRTTQQDLPFANGLFEINNLDNVTASLPDEEFVALGAAPNKWSETDQFYYVQDDWRLTENLTLNLGLRYEYANQPLNRLHDLTVNRESNAATALWSTAIPLGDRTVPSFPTDKNNFAPRVGFAYTPHLWKGIFGTDATVLRGGYTIAYDPTFYNILDNVAASAPTALTLGVVPCGTPGSCAAQFPIPAIPTGNAVQAAAREFLRQNALSLDPRLAAQTRLAPDFHSPYTQQWSFGIERKIGSNGIAEVRYVGNHSIGLFQTVDSNPLVGPLLRGFSEPINGKTISFPGFPNFVPAGTSPGINGRVLPQGPVITYENSAQATYHSLQSSYYGRLLNQVTFGASYTFSKALDNASDVFLPTQAANLGMGSSGKGAAAIANLVQDPFNTNSAEKSFSAFDRRHVLTINGIWDIPLLKSQKGVLGHLLGGWQMNGVYEFASGQRYTPLQSFAFNGYLDNFLPISVPPGSFADFGFFENFARPFTGNPNANPRSVAISQVDAAIFLGNLNLIQNPNGFYSLNALNSGRLVTVSPSDVRYIMNGPGADRIFGTPFGDVARNSQQGPLIDMFNAGLFKNTRVREGLTLQFRFEVFNVLNHPNPGYGEISGDAVPPQLFIDNAGNFGFNNRSLMIPARRTLQFGLKLIF